VITFDFFLWPMLVPLLIPLLYCIVYKRESLVDIVMIAVAMVFIVVAYWPLVTGIPYSIFTYTGIKFLLFVVVPVLLLQMVTKRPSSVTLDQFGVKKEGLRRSIVLCVLFLPIMLLVTVVIHVVSGVSVDTNVVVATVSFFEAFTEEFLFRGVLFIFLLSRTNRTVAYLTSFASFVLMHPQHFTTIFLLGVVVQGVLTIEIARRSENISGAWLLHGINRFFVIAVIPFLL